MHLTTARFNPQSFVTVTHYILIAPHFIFLGGMEARVQLVLCGGLNPGPPVQMSEHALERLTLQPTELAIDRLIIYQKVTSVAS